MLFGYRKPFLFHFLNENYKHHFLQSEMIFLNVFEGVESESAIIPKLPNWQEGGGELSKRVGCVVSSLYSSK